MWCNPLIASLSERLVHLWRVDVSILGEFLANQGIYLDLVVTGLNTLINHCSSTERKGRTDWWKLMKSSGQERRILLFLNRTPSQHWIAFSSSGWVWKLSLLHLLICENGRSPVVEFAIDFHWRCCIQEVEGLSGWLVAHDYVRLVWEFHERATAKTLYTQNIDINIYFCLKISQIWRHIIKVVYMLYGIPKKLRNWRSHYWGTEAKFLI
jgi:hypothetical protein